MLVNHPEESTQQSEHSESLISIKGDDDEDNNTLKQ
jgi:hypothetical protein